MEIFAQAIQWVIWLAIVLLIVGTIFKLPFGLSFKRVNCPNCGTPAPVVRKPANTRQRLWGGHTCENCGTEFDKWGRKVGA